MKLKKLVAGIMAGTMILGSVMSVSASGETDTGYTELVLGSTIEITIESDENIVYTYTPDETGYYKFSSSGDYDLDVELYEEDLYETRLAKDFDGGSFSLNYQLTAGTTYYYVVSSFEDETVTSSLTLETSEADAEDDSDTSATELVLGSTIEVTIEREDNTVTYTYTPEETGYYAFYSTGNYDVYVDLYEEEIPYGWVDFDDHSGQDDNFFITKELKAGTTYYYEVTSTEEEDVSISLTLKKAEVTLELDVPVDITMGSFNYIYCSYTPEETGYYTFSSTGCCEMNVSLYGDKEREDYLYSDWSSGDGEEISLTYELTADKTYYYYVYSYEATTEQLSISASDINVSEVISDVELILDTTTFETTEDIILNGSVVVTYGDGSEVKYTLDNTTYFSAIDDFGNEISVYYGGHISVSTTGYYYNYWVAATAYNVVIDMEICDDLELEITQSVTVTDLSLDEAVESQATGLEYQRYTFTPDTTGDYCFVTQLLSSSEEMDIFNYYVDEIAYANEDNEINYYYGKYNDNGNEVYVTCGDEKYRVYTLTAGVTYYIEVLYNGFQHNEETDVYGDITSSLSITAMTAEDAENYAGTSTDANIEDAGTEDTNTEDTSTENSSTEGSNTEGTFSTDDAEVAATYLGSSSADAVATISLLSDATYDETNDVTVVSTDVSALEEGVTYVVVINGEAVEAYVEDGVLYIKGDVTANDLEGLVIYAAADESENDGINDTDDTDAADDTDSSSTDNTSSTSEKDTGDVENCTAAEIMFLSVIAAGLWVLRRRILNGIR